MVPLLIKRQAEDGQTHEEQWIWCKEGKSQGAGRERGRH